MRYNQYLIIMDKALFTKIDYNSKYHITNKFSCITYSSGAKTSNFNKTAESMAYTEYINTNQKQNRIPELFRRKTMRLFFGKHTECFIESTPFVSINRSLISKSVPFNLNHYHFAHTFLKRSLNNNNNNKVLKLMQQKPLPLPHLEFSSKNKRKKPELLQNHDG